MGSSPNIVSLPLSPHHGLCRRVTPQQHLEGHMLPIHALMSKERVITGTTNNYGILEHVLNIHLCL